MPSIIKLTKNQRKNQRRRQAKKLAILKAKQDFKDAMMGSHYINKPIPLSELSPEDQQSIKEYLSRPPAPKPEYSINYYLTNQTDKKFKVRSKDLVISFCLIKREPRTQALKFSESQKQYITFVIKRFNRITDTEKQESILENVIDNIQYIFEDNHKIRDITSYYHDVEDHVFKRDPEQTFINKKHAFYPFYVGGTKEDHERFCLLFSINYTPTMYRVYSEDYETFTDEIFEW